MAGNKREVIVEAAFEAFAANGFAAARLEDIAVRAGVAKGTLYLYFDNKAALFEAVVRHMILPVVERAEGLLTPSPEDVSAETLLRRQVRTFYREVAGTRLRALLRLMIAEGERFPDLAAFYHREVIARVLDVFRRTLEYGEARGELRATPAREFPQLVIAPLVLAAIWKLTFDAAAPLDVEALCDAHLDVLLDGLRAPDVPAR
ncbi:MAG: TetR/AcrR family transcriptional regulator [Pseudomonadota bacterium]